MTHLPLQAVEDMQIYFRQHFITWAALFFWHKRPGRGNKIFIIYLVKFFPIAGWPVHIFRRKRLRFRSIEFAKSVGSN